MVPPPPFILNKVFLKSSYSLYFFYLNSRIVICKGMSFIKSTEMVITKCWVVNVGVVFKVVDKSQCRFGILSELSLKVVF